MEKVYEGKFMAMPERDEDLFRQINEATAKRRKAWEAKQAMEQCIYSDTGIGTDYEIEALRRAAGTAGRLLMVCLFVGAVARGWCTAGFGLTMAAGCLIWAINRLRRCGKWESSQYQQKTRKRC